MSPDNPNDARPEVPFHAFPPGLRWYYAVTVLHAPDEKDPNRAAVTLKAIEGTSETLRADLLAEVGPEVGMKIAIYVFGTPLPSDIADAAMKMLRREGPPISHLYRDQIESVIRAEALDAPAVGDVS